MTKTGSKYIDIQMVWNEYNKLNNKQMDTTDDDCDGREFCRKRILSWQEDSDKIQKIRKVGHELSRQNLTFQNDI